MSADLDLALELADLAAAVSRPRFERRSFSVTRKPDGSPVTDVDVAVEEALRGRIAQAHPGHAVLGEELGLSGDSKSRWYLDPIDGTNRFVAGDPLWMTLIALARGDEIVLGVVDFPARGERWWASRGEGAFCDGRQVTVSEVSRLSEATVNDDWQGTAEAEDGDGPASDHPLALVAARSALVRPHDGHSFLAVAAGDADVSLSRGGFAWDYAPRKVILEEAGGRFSDFSGRPRIDSREALVTNGLLHEEVLRALRDRDGAR